MAITSRDLTTPTHLPRINGTRITSVLFWLASAWLTEQCLIWKIGNPWLAWPSALVLQLALTKLESGLWHRWHMDSDGKPYHAAIPWYVWPALIVDMLFNVPGTWIGVVQDLHQWPPILAVSDMLIKGGVLTRTMQPLTGWAALLASVIIAVIPCGLPELLWWSGVSYGRRH